MTDPFLWADVEHRAEQSLAEHREQDGSYACDSHVIVEHVRRALEAAVADVPPDPTDEQVERVARAIAETQASVDATTYNSGEVWAMCARAALRAARSTE